MSDSSSSSFESESDDKIEHIGGRFAYDSDDSSESGDSFIADAQQLASSLGNALDELSQLESSFSQFATPLENTIVQQLSLAQFVRNGEFLKNKFRLKQCASKILSTDISYETSLTFSQLSDCIQKYIFEQNLVDHETGTIKCDPFLIEVLNLDPTEEEWSFVGLLGHLRSIVV